MHALMLVAMLTMGGMALDPAPSTSNVLSSRQGTAPFRVVGSGDSIMKLVLPRFTVPDRWVIAEPCRAPWTRGCDNRASTVEEITWLMKSSSPRGFVIVQDGGRGDRWGRITTLSQWELMVRRIVTIVPNDRTIIWVSPGTMQSQVAIDEAFDRAVVAQDVFAEFPTQKVLTVGWFSAVQANPGYVQSDGLHPSAAGAQWMADTMAYLIATNS